MHTTTPFAPIEEAIEQFRQGRMVIIVDDEDRENEGDLAIAAEMVTPVAINFMARFGRGLICLAMTEERCRQLELPLMVEDNTSPFGTAFTISIEARGKITTGISAADRAATIQTAIDPATRPEDLLRPGHVFPLRARRGGVLKRAGQTEGSVDLARLAGLKPAGVICEIMNDDGTMARMPELVKFAKRHGANAGTKAESDRSRPMTIVSIADLIAYRIQRESLVRRSAEAPLPTVYGGNLRAIAYDNALDHATHVALVKGDIRPDEPV